MELEQSLTALFSLQFISLCLAIAGINEILRRITEFVLDNPKVPASKTSKIWTDLFLPISPLFTGVLITAFAKGLPYPEGWGEHRDSRIMIGFIAGLLSGLVYRVASSFLKEKLDGYRKRTPVEGEDRRTTTDQTKAPSPPDNLPE